MNIAHKNIGIGNIMKGIGEILMEIDLRRFRKQGSKVFSGRQEGKKARIELKLDEVEAKNQKISIIIPDDTLSINSSFFLGLFGDSIRKFGENDFKVKYDFKCKDVLKRSVQDGIKRALKSSNPLDFD
jgi:hypothetical protein